jgi:thiol-disulfide isomerase/thioredoxin/DNA-binding ferritin-like protein (Dps family)
VRRKLFGIFSLILFFHFSTSFAEKKFDIGEYPPSLKVEKWLHGDSVSRFQFGRVYVIEFWATWCGPCLDMIPHMNDLAKKYGDDASFVSVAASEHGAPEEQLAEVTNFLSRGQPAFETSVAFDSSGVMSKSWIEAGEAGGIPFAVVIDRGGRIAFTGHPANLDDQELGHPLQRILGGTWVGSAHEKIHLRKQAIERGIRKQYQAAIEAYINATEKKNWEGAYRIAKRAARLPEPYQSIFRALEADMLVTRLGKVARGLKMLPPLVKQDWDSVQALGNILKLLVHDNVPLELRDLALAKKVAERVVELIDHNPDPIAQAKFMKVRWMLLPSVVRFYVLDSDFARAVELQKQMIATLPAGNSKHAQMKQDLEGYEADLALECVGGSCQIQPLDDCNKDLG